VGSVACHRRLARQGRWRKHWKAERSARSVRTGEMSDLCEDRTGLKTHAPLVVSAPDPFGVSRESEQSAFANVHHRALALCLSSAHRFPPVNEPSESQAAGGFASASASARVKFT